MLFCRPLLFSVWGLGLVGIVRRNVRLCLAEDVAVPQVGEHQAHDGAEPEAVSKGQRWRRGRRGHHTIVKRSIVKKFAIKNLKFNGVFLFMRKNLILGSYCDHVFLHNSNSSFWIVEGRLHLHYLVLCNWSLCSVHFSILSFPLNAAIIDYRL